MFAMLFKCFSRVFADVSDTYFKCFIYLLLYVEVLHLDVSKVDRVLHMGCRGKREGRERAPFRRTTQVMSERCGTPRGRTKRRRMQAMSKRRGQSCGREKRGGKRTAAVDVRPNIRALAVPTDEGFRRNQRGRSGSSRQVARRGEGEHCFTFF